MSAWLKIEGLRFSRGKREVLQNLTLELEPGELMLMTGPNGSGKTTLLRIAAGLLKPQRASFHCQEQGPLSWRAWCAYLHAHSCYLHQQPYLFDTSVYSNLAYGLRRRRLPTTEIDQRIHTALERVSLEHLIHRSSRELSGGEQQRVAMLRAWVLRPRLMLLDEPVANMDKLARQQCLGLINQLQQDGIGVVLTSHEPQQGELNYTRHIHLYRGELSEKPIPPYKN